MIFPIGIDEDRFAKPRMVPFIFAHLWLARPFISVYVFPGRRAREGELIRSNSDDWAVFLVQLCDLMGRYALGKNAPVPDMVCSGDLGTRKTRERVEEEVVNGYRDGIYNGLPTHY